MQPIFCKDKAQILKIKKKKQYYQTLTIIIKAFIRFQDILTCWHGSLIRNPLEVTTVFTLFVASLFPFCHITGSVQTPHPIHIYVILVKLKVKYVKF